MTRLTDLEERSEPNDRAVQMALREIDSRLLAEAAVAMVEAEREIVFRNLSKRAHAMIVEEISQAEKTTSENTSKRAKEFFVQKLQKYRHYLTRRHPKDTSVTSPPTLTTQTETEIVESFVELVRFARSHGRLALENAEIRSDFPLANKGLELVIDGWEPMVAREILERLKTTYLEKAERQMDMIIDGIDSLISDDLPIAVEEKLKAYLG